MRAPTRLSDRRWEARRSAKGASLLPAAEGDPKNARSDVRETLGESLRRETDLWSDCYAILADVWGDSREEMILFGSRGFCVYANARPLEKPSLYNMTLYSGM